MATITSQERTNITKLVVGMFNAAPGAAYLAEFTAAYQGLGNSLANLATALGNTGAFKALYPSYLTSAEFATKFLTTLGLQGNQEANDWVVAKVNGGTSYASVILQAITAISNTNDAAFANAKALLNNKTTVAEYYSVTQGTSSDNLGVLQGSIGNVKFDSDVSTADAIKKLIGTGSSTGLKLTLGVDNLTSQTEGAVFVAPIEQNILGAVANTLSDGDTLIGTGTGNVLKADLALAVGVANAPAPAISATTQNIQKVELRAQTGNTDNESGAVHTNTSHIDAERMSGVKEWWTVDSRASIQIEDVRARPEDVTIGMRNTDPEVGFRVYFDPAQLQNTGTVKNSALTLTLDSVLTPGNLTEVPVDGVGFYLGGTLYQLKSDTIGAATNHTELLAALKAAAAAIPALKDVTFTLNANNTITLVDPAGQEFKVGGWQFVNNQVPPAGNIKFDQAVGEPVRGVELITTNVELDAVGRTSAGGNLDIGSLGDGGVEKFIVNVDRASWLETMKSTDHLGKTTPGQVDEDEEDGQHSYLQEVFLNSKGANGNLKVGKTVADRLDGRLAEGLTDVRVVDGSAFKGNLNLGINLTDDATGDSSLARYLDKATAPVTFTYTGGQGNDILNIDVAADVAGHADYNLSVNGGAGDDRVILKVNASQVPGQTAGTKASHLSTTSVDGGTGANTIVVNASVGMRADGYDTFKSFQNFQTYEIEGGDHNFTNLNGVQTVVVATDANKSTTLRNLPTTLNKVTLSGKNQTAGAGNSNKEQKFDDLKLEAAKSTELTVELANTANVDGKLSLNSLTVTDQNATNLSAARTLNVVSSGARSTANIVGEVDATSGDVSNGIAAEKVATFNFSGTQALTARIDAAAHSTSSATPALVDNLKVDGSALTGTLNLWVNSSVVTNVDNVAKKTVSLVGGAGTKDTLTFDDAVTSTTRTSVSGFETVSYKAAADVNATNFSGVSLYKLAGDNGAVKIVGLKAVENFELGTTTSGAAASNPISLQTTNVGPDSALNFTVKATGGSNAQELATSGYTTLNLKIDAGSGATTNKNFVFELAKVGIDGNGNSIVVSSGNNAADTNYFTKVALQNVVLTGGSGNTTGVGTIKDTVNLGELSAVVKNVDVSGYKGTVTATIGDALDNTGSGNPLVTTGNTTVKVGAYGINFTDTDHAASTVDTVTAFVFTTDAFKDSTNAVQKWQISNFQGIKEHVQDAGFTSAAVAGGTLSDLTVLDLSAFGIRGLQDMVISESENAVAANNVVTIKSNINHNFVIELSGVYKDQLDLANFKFAV